MPLLPGLCTLIFRQALFVKTLTEYHYRAKVSHLNSELTYSVPLATLLALGMSCLYFLCPGIAGVCSHIFPSISMSVENQTQLPYACVKVP